MHARAGLIVGLVAVIGCSGLPRAGDPARLLPDDPRAAACGIARSDMWMVFSMAHARDFPQHFPGWSEGADELLVADPALVIISNGSAVPRMNELGYVMCIAIGPPSDALIHRYGPTRFDAVRPDLAGPPVPMP